MSNCIDYNCTDIDEHLKSTCGAQLLGGMDQAVLLDCDHQITDPTDGTQINAEIAAGRAVLVQQVKYAMPLPEPIEVPSQIACQPDVLVNYNRTLTILDGNINAQNITHYRTVFAGRSLGGIILYECGNDTKKVTWIDAVVKATGGRQIPAEATEFQNFQGTFKWRKLTEPMQYDAPTGVFS